jgi:hypothetical protein
VIWGGSSLGDVEITGEGAVKVLSYGQFLVKPKALGAGVLGVPGSLRPRFLGYTGALRPEVLG